jgi:hypothetical protein
LYNLLTMRNFVPVVAMSAALLAAACSTSSPSGSPEGYPVPAATAEAPDSPLPTAPETTVPETTTTVPATTTTIARGSKTKGLFAQNTEVHFIFEPVVPTAPPDPGTTEADIDKVEETLASELVSGDAEYIQRTTDEIVTAANNRFQPAGITVSETGPLTLGSTCLLDTDLSAIKAIRTLAQSSIKAGVLNTIVVDVRGCVLEDLSRIGGFNSTDGNPILTKDALLSLGNNTMHEFGHGGNLEHANEEVCADPETISDCELHATADPGSIMSYEHKVPSINYGTSEITPSLSTDSTHYSTPELAVLGMLNASEMLSDPADGEYTISNTKDNDDRSSLKLITLNTDKGELALSWEEDPQADFDTTCDAFAGADTLEGVRKEVSLPADSILYTTKKADGSQYICYKTNIRNMSSSLQVRLATTSSDGMKGFDLVTRPDRNNEVSNTPTPERGEVNAGTILYRDTRVTVTFVGQADDGSAHVTITHIA